MNSTDTDGRAMHDADAETRRQAASAMGRARTERKVQASRANAALATEARRGKPLSEETKALLSTRQQERRERERQERAAAEATGAVEKRGPGRPRKEQPEEAGEKRGRGRPKKQDALTTAQEAGASHRGAQEAETA